MHHAALLTHGGELYTWGSGAGGKLGHGNNQDAASPQRVHTLWGKSVQCIECGGEHQPTSAMYLRALSRAPSSLRSRCMFSSTLATTGCCDCYALSDNQACRNVSLEVPHELQVSAQPFLKPHACPADTNFAAITFDGALYTWGDGSVGNLGYGHTLRQFIPRRVEQGLGNFCIVQVLLTALRLVVGV